jgi:type II secretory pathway component PulJ
MNRTNRRGVTLVEAGIAGALLVIILGSLAFATSGARRTESLAALHLGLMESVALAMHQLRTDLRQLSFVPGKDVATYSLRVGRDYHSLIMRRSSPYAVGNSALGSSMVLVEYRLVPAARADRFHLLRIEKTASGANLPGKSVPREERLYRSFMLASADFLYREDDAKDDRVLHVAFRVVSDSGPMPGWGPFREKELMLTNVLSVLRPEQAYAAPRFQDDPAAEWAAKMTVQAEMPGEDVLAPGAQDAVELPIPGEDDGQVGGSPAAIQA